MEFIKSNIAEQWEWDLVNEFPKFFLEISEEVMNFYNKRCDKNIVKIEDLVNLRYGFEFHSNWKNIVRDHLISIEELIKKADDNGHEISYKGFIMKEKFNTLRDQGDFGGNNKEIYRNEYYDLVDNLYKKSSKVNQFTE